MTITIEIQPEVQAELARQAASQGRPIEAVAATLLEDAVRVARRDSMEAKNLVELTESVRGLLTDEEIDHLFGRDRSPSRPIDLS